MVTQKKQIVSERDWLRTITSPPFETLLKTQPMESIINHFSRKSSGLFIATGQPGTGKTTLLILLAYIISKKDIPIFVITDELDTILELPEEWNVCHCETKQSWTRTFKKRLEDPKGIAVIDSLNPDTAQPILQAVIQKQSIFTTLDTPFFGIDVLNNLRGLGLDNRDVLDNLTGIVSQMLLLPLCKHCAVKEEVSVEDARLVYPETNYAKMLWREKGCDQCDFHGTKGRTAVHDVLFIDNEIRQSVQEYYQNNIFVQYPSSKHLTIQESARELVKQGIIGIETYKREVFQNPLLRLNYFLEVEQLRSVQLAHAAKMASLGELVAGIAHEINTPLGVIISNNDMIMRYVKKLEPSEKDEKLIEKIVEKLSVSDMSSESILNIVNSLRVFARLDEAEYQNAAVHDLMDNTLVIMKNKLKKDITIVKNYLFKEPIECFPSQLNQVFVNIINNAYDAMNGKGTLNIVISATEGKVVMSICDSGQGIPEDNMEKIFDPGFTTKGVGVGTGLGLSICHRIIVEKHGGRIWAENSPEGGACIHIELPKKEKGEIQS